jgi:acetyl esterase/lipase
MTLGPVRAAALAAAAAAFLEFEKDRLRYGKAALRLLLRALVSARVLLQSDEAGIPCGPVARGPRPSARLRAFNSVLTGGPVGSYDLRAWRFGMGSGIWGDVGAEFSAETRGTLARVGGVPGRWFGARGAGWAPRSPRVLYLHGGGFTAGSPGVYASFCTQLSRGTDARVFAAAYRLAPEHALPAAVDDAYAAYGALVRLGREGCVGSSGEGGEARGGGFAGRCRRLVVAGDSAGGGLVVLLLQRIRMRGELPMPAAAVAVSPSVGLAGSSASHEQNAARDQLFRIPGAFALNSALAVGGDAAKLRDPACNGLLAPAAAWARLPPLLVMASECELLRDDAIECAAKARAGGAAVRLVIKPHVPHVWPLFLDLFPEAREALGEISAFVRDEVCSACALGGSSKL